MVCVPVDVPVYHARGDCLLLSRTLMFCAEEVAPAETLTTACAHKILHVAKRLALNAVEHTPLLVVELEGGGVEVHFSVGVVRRFDSLFQCMTQLPGAKCGAWQHVELQLLIDGENFMRAWSALFVYTWDEAAGGLLRFESAEAVRAGELHTLSRCRDVEHALDVMHSQRLRLADMQVAELTLGIQWLDGQWMTYRACDRGFRPCKRYRLTVEPRRFVQRVWRGAPAVERLHGFDALAVPTLAQREHCQLRAEHTVQGLWRYDVAHAALQGCGQQAQREVCVVVPDAAEIQPLQKAVRRARLFVCHGVGQCVVVPPFVEALVGAKPLQRLIHV
eukprot:1582942-Rhodomonas_salina.2